MPAHTRRLSQSPIGACGLTEGLCECFFQEGVETDICWGLAAVVWKRCVVCRLLGAGQQRLRSELFCSLD